MKLKEYIALIVCGVIPIILCAVAGALLIKLIFTTDTACFITGISFAIIICYPFVKYIEWLSTKI